MSEADQELMRRYIYAVTKRLRKEQRNEVAMELTELISDMYESKSDNMEEVLMELGEPKKFARQYMGLNEYLIGPEYFDNYIWMVRIMVVCVSVAVIISAFFSLDQQRINFIDFIVHICADVLTSILGSIGMLTVVFAIMEYTQVKVKTNDNKGLPEVLVGANSDGKKKENSWNPSMLSAVPEKKALISRSDSIVSIVVVLVMAAFVAFSSKPIGVYVMSGGHISRTIPIFNMEHWGIICTLLMISFLASLIDEVVKLVTGCYCKVVLVCSVITNALQLFFLTILFRFVPVWNPDFVTDIKKTFGSKVTSKQDILYYWNTDKVNQIILAIIWIITLSELGYTIYKTAKYSKDRDELILFNKK